MNPESPKLNRREALALMAAAAGAVAAFNQQAFGAAPGPAQPYGTDALLNKIYKPGDFWPLTLTKAQSESVRALADLILPADDQSPAASEVGVVEFIDEWISAPYETHQADRKQILEGLEWLNAEAGRRFSKPFDGLNPNERAALADDIAFLDKAKAEFQGPAAFFAKFRNIAAGGYYATKQGMKDLGYVGNVPLGNFTGPPRAIRTKLGV